MNMHHTKLPRVTLAAVGVALLAAGTLHAADRVEHVVTVTNDVTLTWQWTPQYAYGVTNTAGGSVAGTTNDWYDTGVIVSNTPLADMHYRFDGWLNAPDGMASDNPLTFAIDAPYTNVTAVFTLKDYTLTVVSDFAPWGLTDIGAPAPGTRAYQALSTATQSVDRIVLDPANPGRRLRTTGAVVE